MNEISGHPKSNFSVIINNVIFILANCKITGNAFDHDRVQHLITNHRGKIKELISEQTTEWSELILRQLTEEHLIKIEQVRSNMDV